MDSGGEITFIQPNYNHVLRIWWAFVWRSLLLGLVVAIVAPFLFRPLMIVLILLAGGTREAASLVANIVGYGISISVQVYVLWSLLYKDFGQFAIRLAPPTEPTHLITTADFLAPTLGHALRIWWAWFWRVAAVTITITFVVSILSGFLGLVMGFASHLLAGAFFMKTVLRKNFKGFRVHLVSPSYS